MQEAAVLGVSETEQAAEGPRWSVRWWKVVTGEAQLSAQLWKQCLLWGYNL